MFKAAIVGAGVSNWESMVMEAASPELEVSSHKEYTEPAYMYFFRARSGVFRPGTGN